MLTIIKFLLFFNKKITQLYDWMQYNAIYLWIISEIILILALLYIFI